MCKTCIDESKCDGQMSKYKNKKVVYKDMKFDSKKEYLRYLVLEDMQRKGGNKWITNTSTICISTSFSIK